MTEPEIVEQREDYLLVRSGRRFAIVQRRNGRIYDLSGGPREGQPDTGAGIRAAVDAVGGWGEEAETRARLDELLRRGQRLAERLW